MLHTAPASRAEAAMVSTSLAPRQIYPGLLSALKALSHVLSEAPVRMSKYWAEKGDWLTMRAVPAKGLMIFAPPFTE